MDKAKESRRIIRQRFTKCVSKVENILSQKDKSALLPEYERLGKLFEELSIVQNKVLDMWLDDDQRDEKLLEQDVDASDCYEARWYEIKYKVKEFLDEESQCSNKGTVKEIDKTSNSSESITKRRNFRLPKLQLPSFDGEIKNWIGFWSQFNKIHIDSDIDNDDKFHYLLQCMEQGSIARGLVKSFPPNGENYQKVVKQLKERFAKDELIIEHYVRELLQLVLAQSKGAKITLRVLYDKLMTQILALDSLGVTQEKYAAFLFPLVESALPEDVLKAWNRSHTHVHQESNTLTKLLNFVKLEVESDEKIRMARTGFSDKYSEADPTAACFTTTDRKNERNQPQNKVEKTDRKCLWCDKTSHASSECLVAIKKTLDERKDFVRNKKACYICLAIGHMWNRCRRHPKCVICGRRHYPIMCGGLARDKDTITQRTTESSNPQETILNQSSSSKTVLLQTLKINLVHGSNKLTVRALLDSGAQRSFVTSEIVKKLKLEPIDEVELSHTLFGGAVTKKQKHKLYDFSVKNLHSSFVFKIQALEQEVICGSLPKLNKSDTIISLLKKKGVVITDCIDDNVIIDLLIGSDVLGCIITGRTVRVDENLLALETRLGWTVQGPVVGTLYSINNVSTFHTSTFDVQDFWSLETMGIRDDTEIKCQKRVESEVLKFFNSTVKVNESGRYEVRLPWKDASKCLESNYGLAFKRLMSTTYKLESTGIIEEYDDVFKDWLNSGIIEIVQNDDNKDGHYLAHHAVVKAESLTTKIRPVFDASAVDKNGLSLNMCLEKGTNLIELIPKLIINFRRNAIGITSDIKKAFLQISLWPEDREYFKFLWWNNIKDQNKKLITYRHQRVVFGVTTSPFLLAATILKHLKKYDSETAEILRTSYYVDNCVNSVNSLDDMHRFIRESKRIMLEGNFELRCWVTGPVITDEKVVTTSVLGLKWNPRDDTLYCKTSLLIKYNTNKNITKRYMLSVAQSVFDPIGFLSPVTIVPKVIIQKCWIRNISWDETLPEDLVKTSKDWLQQIPHLEACRVPRCISKADLRDSHNTVHVFCDASLAAYACCIFLRSEFNSEVTVQLLTAKSRVCPSKAVTMPRLELLAALLAARVAADIRRDLNLNCPVFYWTDSSIVLAWLNRKVNLNVFVNNRIQEILNKSVLHEWRHVPGECNPADLPSRGCNAENLFKSKWWEGPEWLKKSESEWPNIEVTPDENEVFREVKKSCLCVVNTKDFSKSLLYFGKYSKIVRMVGWCLRFHNNCGLSLKKEHRRAGDLSAEEYTEAENRLVAVLQRECLIDFSKNNKKLQTFFNDKGLVCVKTRLTMSNDSDSFMSPILLSSDNVIVERIVQYFHVKYLHAGSQTLISKLRERYWIISIRRLAKKVVRQCVVCKRFSSKSCTVPSAPLPTDRIQCGSPFEATGIDLAGPLYLKTGEKCWIVLFTCATYRAVHLDLCSSLSTEDFMLTFRRFVARRGSVRIIYTDNGTNFRGASSILKNIKWNEIAQETSTQRIEWRFIPPSAPWWGGFWERMVRTVKEMLRRVLGRAALKYNELLTVLCETEAMINSRPLTYIADSTENLAPLTPSMFLHVGKEGKDVLDMGHIDGQLLTGRWRYIKNVCGDLKQRFRSEYLALLTQKSTANINPVEIGDIVLIGSDDVKRVKWPLGIVVETLQGVDGHRRVARVRTAKGELIRPLQRVFPLEVHHRDVPTTAPAQQLPTKMNVTRSGRLVKLPTKYL